MSPAYRITVKSIRLTLALYASERAHVTDNLAPSPQVTESALVGKILKRLAPFLAILYIFCLLDRGNVSIAANSMQLDLGFSDRVYGLGAGIFFLGYFLFEVPSNLIMERVGARLWIFRIMITWGLISAAMMFVKSPFSFYSLRFLLGLAEAGFFPGVILYITYWIPATSRARAIATFLTLTGILGLFQGPLGGLLLGMDSLAGLQGWQWLFLIEGIPSVLLGFAVLVYLPDRPMDAAWLSPEEKHWLLSRLSAEAHNEHTVRHLSLSLLIKDSRILHLCLIFLISATAGNAVGFFGPKLIQARSGGAWSDSFVASIGIIPAIVGAVAMWLASGHSDRSGKRRHHVAGGYFVAALGFLGCVYAPTAWWTVAALALNALGERIGAGSYWALVTNLLGVRAAAGGIALINSVGNLGGFFGPVIMGHLKERSGGGYAAGLLTATGLMVAAALLALALRRQPTHSATEVDETPEAATSLAR